MSHADYLEKVTRAYEEGKKAAETGTPEDACPYNHPDSPMRRYWLRGLRETALKEALEENHV